jgi:transposase
MLYLGIDWSEDHHNVCILNEAGARVSQIEFEHSLAGFERMEAERRKLQVPVQECPVAIETSYNLIVDFLLEHDYPVYIVPPQATDGYRNRQRSSGAHDDDSDAALLAGIMRTDRESHQRWQPNTALTQQILTQVRLVETLRRSIQRQENQLRAVLQRANPIALRVFSELMAQITLQFLIVYPTAQMAQGLSREAFETFCREHGYTRVDQLPLRYARLLESSPVTDPSVGQAYATQISVLAEVLLCQERCRLQAITRLGQLFHQHPEASIFESLPGAADLLAPSLLAKFGDHRDRFPTPGAVQALAGTCPVTKRSGKKKVIKFRHGCDKEFRRIAQQFARASVSQSGWAAAYWKEIRPNCDNDSHAYRVLANRWLVIIWKMWQDRRPYDEDYHLQQRALRRKTRS